MGRAKNKPSPATAPPKASVTDSAATPPHWTEQPRVHFAAIAAILLAHFFLAWGAAQTKSLTFDEHAHLVAGAAYLTLHDARLNPEHPPLAKCIAALPARGIKLRWEPSDPYWQGAEAWIGLMREGKIDEGRAAIKQSVEHQWGFAQRYLYQYNREWTPWLLARSRAVMAALSALGGLMLWLWARRALGAIPALAAASLWAFCPNILGHAPLANTDVPVAVFTGAFLWALYESLAAPRGFRGAWKPLAALSLSLAAALLTKHTSLLLLPFMALALGLFAIREPRESRATFLKTKIPALAAAGLGALAIMLGFYGALFGDWSLRLYRWSVALVAEKVLFNPGVQTYMLGKIATRFYSYFLVAALLKMTLPSLALFAAQAARSAKERSAWRDPLQAYLWLFIFYFMAGLSLRFPNIGVRHMLPLWPAVFILAAGLARPLPRAGWPRWALGGLLAWHAWCAIIACPNYVSYMNGLSLAKGKDFYLSDSNLDWGQDLPALGRYMKRSGDAKMKAMLSVQGDPSFYGAALEEMNWDLPAASPPGTKVAVSVFIYQSSEPLRNELAERWTRVRNVNDTIYVYQKR